MSTKWFHTPQQNLSQCFLRFIDGICVVYVSGNYCRLMHLYFRSEILLLWRRFAFPPGKCCVLINGRFGMKTIFDVSFFFMGILHLTVGKNCSPSCCWFLVRLSAMSSGIGYVGLGSVERIGHHGPKMLFWLSMGKDVLIKAQNLQKLSTLLTPSLQLWIRCSKKLRFFVDTSNLHMICRASIGG